MREVPHVPREERDEAIGRLKRRHPQYAASLLWSAKAGAVFAKVIDSMLRIRDWCNSASRVASRFPRLSPKPPTVWPQILFKDRTTGEQFEGDWADWERFLSALRVNLTNIKELLEIGREITADLGDEAQLELARNPYLMSAAFLLSGAKKRNVRLSAADYSDVAIAIGLERDDEEGISGDSRWRKRMPAIRSLAMNWGMTTPMNEERDLNSEFFESL